MTRSSGCWPARSLLDRSAVRDRYQQLTATAWELLSDFRQVEENFRRLDRQLREKIAGWQGGKGELLDDVLGSRESIAGSDQGRSFQAFYDFLLSQARQEELAGLLDRVNELSDLAERDPRLRRVHYDWLDAAGRTQAVVAQLSEQLRRFLDDQAWFENRRVIDVLREIEGSALRLRDAPPSGLTMEIDAAAPELPADGAAPLHPVRKPRLDSQDIRPAGSDERPTPPPCSSRSTSIRAAPRQRPRALRRRRAGRAWPRPSPQRRSRHGLAELVAYLSLATTLQDHLRRHRQRASHLDRTPTAVSQDRHLADASPSPAPRAAR